MGLFSFLFNDRRRPANPHRQDNDDLEQTTLICTVADEMEKTAPIRPTAPDPSEDVSDATMMIPRVRTRTLSDEVPTANASASSAKDDHAVDDLMDAISAAVQSKTSKKPAKPAAQPVSAAEQISAAVQSNLNTPPVHPDLEELIPDEDPAVPSSAAAADTTETGADEIEKEDDLEKTRLFSPQSSRFSYKTEPVPQEMDTAASEEEPAEEPAEESVTPETESEEDAEDVPVLTEEAVDKTSDEAPIPEEDPMVNPVEESTAESTETVCAPSEDPVAEPEEEPSVPEQESEEDEEEEETAASEDALSDERTEETSVSPEQSEFTPFQLDEQTIRKAIESDFDDAIASLASTPKQSEDEPDMSEPAEEEETDVLERVPAETEDSSWGSHMYQEKNGKPSIPTFSDECFRMTWKLKGTSKKRRLRAISECVKGQPVFIICDPDGTNCTVITEDGEEIGRLSEQDSAVYHSMIAGKPHNLYIKKIRSSQFEKTTVKILVIARAKQESLV